MTALGAFLPLFRIRQSFGPVQRFLDAQLTVTETAWGSSFDVPGQEVAEQTGSPVGVPLLLAVAVLVAGALLAFLRPDRGRWVVAGGAVFAAGVVVTVGMDGIGWSVSTGGENLDVTLAPGMWLLIGGVVAAAAAAVLACLPGRRPGWADPAVAYADTPTPPSGVAITVLPPDEPEEPADRGP
ncbi:hypothetical protein [Amycolatopsis vancoresmycina]|uniref:Uncharacterized protein n=1 Tax=Amycolatopsis vancoresmycina DSM 44592 TaxID=1292037 RepID=R1HVE3_9PSEU|nr:hypothetical protein [Amycolatopsis vancoresmycina]EOD64331.1 hypothetical protein H480_32368 [Amycolatopsis vancoresmycina DSM 44592]